jgi:hypothetical protein
MRTLTRRVRARVRGRHLELLEDLNLPPDQEVTVGIEVPVAETDALLRAIEESAGAWSDADHPDLKTREDVSRFLAVMRVGFERGHGG